MAYTVIQRKHHQYVGSNSGGGTTTVEALLSPTEYCHVAGTTNCAVQSGSGPDAAASAHNLHHLYNRRKRAHQSTISAIAAGNNLPYTTTTTFYPPYFQHNNNNNNNNSKSVVGGITPSPSMPCRFVHDQPPQQQQSTVVWPTATTTKTNAPHDGSNVCWNFRDATVANKAAPTIPAPVPKSPTERTFWLTGQMRRSKSLEVSKYLKNTGRSATVAVEDDDDQTQRQENIGQLQTTSNKQISFAEDFNHLSLDSSCSTARSMPTSCSWHNALGTITSTKYQFAFNPLQRHAIKATWSKIACNRHRTVKHLVRVFHLTLERSGLSARLYGAGQFLQRLEKCIDNPTAVAAPMGHIRTKEGSAQAHARCIYELFSKSVPVTTRKRPDVPLPDLEQIVAHHVPLVNHGFTAEAWEHLGQAFVDMFLMQEQIQGYPEARRAWMHYFAYLIDQLSSEFTRQLQANQRLAELEQRNVRTSATNEPTKQEQQQQNNHDHRTNSSRKGKSEAKPPIIDVVVEQRRASTLV